MKNDIKEVLLSEEQIRDKVKELAAYLQSYIIVKGAWTCIVTPEGTYHFNPTGNPGMATGGSGDVLSGIIASFISQGMDAFRSAIAGVYVHGLTGDDVTKKYSMMGNTPSLILKELPMTLGKIEQVII